MNSTVIALQHNCFHAVDYTRLLRIMLPELSSYVQLKSWVLTMCNTSIVLVALPVKTKLTPEVRLLFSCGSA